MIRILKLFALSCVLALTAAGSVGLYAPGQVLAQSSVQPEKQRRAGKLIEDALHILRFADIYGEARYAARELYQPYYEALALKLGETGVAPKQVHDVETVARLLGFAVTASDELEPVLERRRSEMIADYATVFARHMTNEQLDLVEDALGTPSARKFGNIFYAYTRMLTGYNRADFQSLDDVTSLAFELDIEFGENPLKPGDGPPPPTENVQKAEAIVTDFLRVSRFDDMVSDIVSFGNNTLLKLDSLEPSERAEISNGIRQIQFYYNLIKSMAVAVAPSALAKSASLDDLDKLHRIVLAPIVSKSFALIHDLVREVTSFSVLDLTTMKKLAHRGEELEDQGLAYHDKANEEFEDLGEKWAEILMDSLTPETRQGLEQSIEDLSSLAEEGKRQIKEQTGNGETQL